MVGWRWLLSFFENREVWWGVDSGQWGMFYHYARLIVFLEFTAEVLNI